MALHQAALCLRLTSDPMAEPICNPIACSIGIMAHNEEADIGRLLGAIVSRRTDSAMVTEIIVVASGCADQTEAVVRSAAERDPRIRLIAQSHREGKAAAVNRFLAEAREEIAVLCSADLLPRPDAIKRLVAPLTDPAIGMTTSHPLPVNDPQTFMGFAAHLLWNLHHQINLKHFKAGELVSFRKIFDRIPYQTPVDEASIEPVIRGAGYNVRYVPEAIVLNKGAETLADFLRQRRRIYAGHLAVRDTTGYTVSTMNGLRIFGLVLKTLDWRPRKFVWTWAVAALEVYGRFLGWWDYKMQREHRIWEIAETTKDLEPELSAEQLAS